MSNPNRNSSGTPTPAPAPNETPTPVSVTPNILSFLTAEEIETLELAFVGKYRHTFGSLMEATPSLSMAECYILSEARKDAKTARISQMWARFGQMWKGSAESEARKMLSEDVNIRKEAKRKIANLRDDVPEEKRKDILDHVIKALDRGSKDARVVAFKKVWDTGIFEVSEGGAGV